MKHSNLSLENHWDIVEHEYNLETEANVASLFTTGNGYIGVRGSLEELGSVRIQGAYIRGVIDTIYELPQPFLDNIYMKKYYFDEYQLKHFEKEESIVNFADFLLVRIAIGGETFYPWDGTLLSWNRTLSIEHACLVRDLRWENSKGQITSIRFERFSSFTNDHIYAQKVTVTPENYSDKIEILSGIDCITKTNGQLVCTPISKEINENRVVYENLSGETYKFEIATGVINHLYDGNEEHPEEWLPVNNDDFVANRITFIAQENKSYTLEKTVYIASSCDKVVNPKAEVNIQLNRLSKVRYSQLYTSHCKDWMLFFENLDIQIEGDNNADMSLRFSNYHTALTISRNDHIHSLSAKGLTGEIYNNFVWWDCEIYQSPIFFQTVPEIAKNILLYRYDRLDAARKIAMQENRHGARFPFTSSVTGEETVWKYARHPFMQVHIVADVGWAVCNYYLCTGDDDFMKEYGLEMLFEVARFWADRVEENNGRYVINNVTGTDEHHPFVNNNAYTNYEVCYVLQNALRLFDKFREDINSLMNKICMTASEIEQWRHIATNLYLPMDKTTGMIPQFDGYFDLNRNLETTGGSSAKSFQMKQSGLYHKSQVIKQPDVMLLFSYLNISFDRQVYSRNWDYYQARCESASSLSYSVHAICAADLSLPESAYSYFLKTARLDLDDEHDCAWQGIHTACAAGAWLAIVRGIAGVVYHENSIELHPNMIPWWKSITFSIIWHKQIMNLILDNETVSISAPTNNKYLIPIRFKDHCINLNPGCMVNLKTVECNQTIFEFC